MSYKQDLQANNTELKGIYTTIKSGVKRSALPVEVATEDEMTEILANATAESVGSIYKYIGLTKTYINGAHYIIQEEI